MGQLFASGSQSIGVSASVSVLPMISFTHRTDLLQNGLVASPCSPRDSQESSPTPQFKSINSSVLSFLHSPTLTSIHGHQGAEEVSNGYSGTQSVKKVTLVLGSASVF